MNILYIALACHPNKGSEARIGWKVPMHSAKNNQVYVVTSGKNRPDIEAYLQEHPVENIQFLYVKLDGIYNKIIRGPLSFFRLKALQRRALKLVKEFCQTHPVDVIHQINPVEFRSIGKYGTIDGPRFVCGPVGGGEYIPDGLKSYACRYWHIETLRKIANRLSRWSLRRNRTLTKCDTLMFANRETQQYVLGNRALALCVSEIGIDQSEIIPRERANGPGKPVTFLIAGRLSYRKGHALALDAFHQLPKELEYSCYIIGSGPEEQRLKAQCKRLGLEQRVRFISRVPFEQMEEYYKQADVLLVPSLRETTGSVILEGMARGLPVITSDRFGGSLLVNEQTGWNYPIQGKAQTVQNVKDTLAWCIGHPQEVACKGAAAQQAAYQETWENRVAFYQQVYHK